MHGTTRPGAENARFADLFMPKIVTVFREGYGWRELRADTLAGLTVAIVALPLALAIAIASGVGPERGLFAAIVAGFIASLLGGSRFQISGPTSAFIVVVFTTVERHGYDGLVIATILSGLMLVAVGLLRLGTYIKYIPYPVVAGFSAGIAVTILLTQVGELLGLDVELPGEVPGKIAALWNALGTVDPATVAISLLGLGIILGLKALRPNWPGFLIAVGVGSVVAALAGLDVDTIGSRFGGIPNALPAPSLPEISLAKIKAVFPDAVTIALLAGIEALLSAVIADSMSGSRHRSNSELVAQGLANIGSVIFGGIPGTGALARTATNVRAGARGPVAGILHAVFLLMFMMVAAPLVSYVPLAALGAVLAVVAWNMSDHRHFRHILRGAMGDRATLLVTFFLTIFVDLTVAIQVGVVMAALLFMHRMAEVVEIETGDHLIRGDMSDSDAPYDAARGSDREVVVFRIDGPFFFGTAARVAQVLDRIGARPKVFILDFEAVPFVDSTAAHALDSFVAKAHGAGVQVIFANVRRQPRQELRHGGLKPPKVRYASSVEDALEAAHGGGAQPLDETVALT